MPEAQLASVLSVPVLFREWQVGCCLQGPRIRAAEGLREPGLQQGPGCGQRGALTVWRPGARLLHQMPMGSIWPSPCPIDPQKHERRPKGKEAGRGHCLPVVTAFGKTLESSVASFRVS